MTIPRPVSFERFLKAFGNRWEQGEHVFISGQTGSGKTDLEMRLLTLRTHSVLFVTKPRDAIFKDVLAKPYRKVTEFKPTLHDKRLMLYAKRGDSTRNDVGNQHEIFSQALDRIYKLGGFAVGSDETLWISNRLKLADKLGDISFMGRALGISVVSCSQRPANLPVIIPQSATHAFISKTGHKGDLDRLSELGGDTEQTKRALKTLRDPHDFLYVDTAGKMPLQIVNTHR